MIQKEFRRVRVIENARGGMLSVGEVSRLLQLSERQVQRLKRRHRPDSIGRVQRGNRGRSTTWTLPVACCSEAVDAEPGAQQVPEPHHPKYLQMFIISST